MCMSALAKSVSIRARQTAPLRFVMIRNGCPLNELFQSPSPCRFRDEKWRLPIGVTPTSHIFKPAMKEGPDGADFSDTPWNEWLCLELCRTLGLDAAQAKVILFVGKPVIIVERFDRIWHDGILYRLPQEDLCQAMGVPPSRKYQSDGGPGIIEVLQFLNSSEYPYEDRLKFIKAQIVFWLLAAIDGHAKNFSVFITPSGFKLTPIYDDMLNLKHRKTEDKIELHSHKEVWSK
jgi:serine/threonine-protein kinase HipA